MGVFSFSEAIRQILDGIYSSGLGLGLDKGVCLPFNISLQNLLSNEDEGGLPFLKLGLEPPLEYVHLLVGRR